MRRSTISVDAEVLTSSRTTSPKRRLRSWLSTASSRSAASSDTSKSASRVTRNAARSTIVAPGKSIGRKCAMTCSSGTIQPSSVDLVEPRQPLRDLDAREALLTRLGVGDKDREREREAGDVRERLARARLRAASARGRSRAGSALSSCFSSFCVAVLDAADDDALGGERRREGRASRAGTACAVSSRTRSRMRASACCGVRPSAERTASPDSACPRRPATRTWKNSSRFEEKIEQNRTRSSSGTLSSAGQLEHARVEVEERELAVEKPFGGLAGGTRRHASHHP